MVSVSGVFTAAALSKQEDGAKVYNSEIMDMLRKYVSLKEKVGGDWFGWDKIKVEGQKV